MVAPQFVIRIIAYADGRPDPDGQTYVRTFDPNQRAGRGLLIKTRNVNLAKWFDSPEAAWAYWRQRSRVKPFRPDGQPNRPLTAYTVVVQAVAET